MPSTTDILGSMIGAVPDELRRAHDHSHEVLERAYIGRRFRNDTERPEKWFDRYIQMTAARTGNAKATDNRSADRGI